MTILTGLIGDPVSHSLSPYIHAYWMKEHGILGDYKLFTTKPARLRQTMQHMRKKNVRGVNITVPHKQAVLEYLDAVDALATRIGAVNTVTNINGVFTGTNTDAYGFITNLRAGLGDLTPYLSNVILLGAGGATRAAIIALQEAGATRITLLNRTLATAEALANEFSSPHRGEVGRGAATHTTLHGGPHPNPPPMGEGKICAAPWEARNGLLGEATLLVNTTSLGMAGQPSLDLDIHQLPKSCAVHDIVYAPLETKLLKFTSQRGHPTVDGLGMLFYQAQKAFHAWHGVEPAVTPALRHYILGQRHDVSA